MERERNRGENEREGGREGGKEGGREGEKEGGRGGRTEERREGDEMTRWREQQKAGTTASDVAFPTKQSIHVQ